MSLFLEIIIIVLLVILNGFFAMSEIALISSRRAVLEDKAKKKIKGANAALILSENPNKFLSTVQVGLTTIGILMGAFGGTTIAKSIEFLFLGNADIAPYAPTLSFILVVVVTSYLSLVFGELVPKRLALSNAENIASFSAPLMNFISLITKPFIKILSVSTEAVLFLFGAANVKRPKITEEEIAHAIEEGRRVGLVEPDEQRIVKRVFEFGDRPAHSIMTPRTDVVWLDLSESPKENMKKISENPHSRFPVIREQPDIIVGIINARDLLQRPSTEPVSNLEPFLQTPLFVPEHMSALHVLQLFRAHPLHIAIVIDEYGGFRGVITAYDLLQALVGELPAEQAQMPAIKKSEENSWLIDGGLPIQEFKVFFNINELPQEQRYGTLSGFAMQMLGHIPLEGEHFEWGGFDFKVTEMTDHRVGKLLVKGGQPEEGKS